MERLEETPVRTSCNSIIPQLQLNSNIQALNEASCRGIRTSGHRERTYPAHTKATAPIVQPQQEERLS